MLTNLVAALEIRVSVEAPQIEYVIFWKAPSIGVVYLVPETGNRLRNSLSQEPCRRLKLGPEAYLRIAPSIGVVCLVAQTGKRVLLEPGAM